MLEAFDYLAKRESIKAAVKKKAESVIQLFSDELDKAKHEYDKLKNESRKTDINESKKQESLSFNMPLTHGKYSGQAIWIYGLIKRIKKM